MPNMNLFFVLFVCFSSFSRTGLSTLTFVQWSTSCNMVTEFIMDAKSLYVNIFCVSFPKKIYLASKCQ